MLVWRPEESRRTGSEHVLDLMRKERGAFPARPVAVSATQPATHLCTFPL